MQNDFWSKNANIRFLFNIREYWTINVQLRIVKLESGGRQQPVIRKKRSKNSFDHNKMFFFTNSTKNVCFYQNHRMLNNYSYLYIIQN